MYGAGEASEAYTAQLQSAGADRSSCSVVGLLLLGLGIAAGAIWIIMPQRGTAARPSLRRGRTS